MAHKKLKYWFDKELAKLLADKIIETNPKFNKKVFIKNVHNKVEDLELKARVEAIADELYYAFDANYKLGINNLMNTLGPENNEETGMFSNFYWLMPMAKYVEKYGLDDFEISIKALEEITKRNTSEYAIRPFIVKHYKGTMAQMKKWSKSNNSHERRLASEGVRPRLPWAQKLDKFVSNPKPIIPILNNLKDDPSKYVQKSVANCINDILKDNSEIGKKLIESWHTKNSSTQRKWIIKHALRNLLKEKDKWALKMIS